MLYVIQGVSKYPLPRKAVAQSTKLNNFLQETWDRKFEKNWLPIQMHDHLTVVTMGG